MEPRLKVTAALLGITAKGIYETEYGNAAFVHGPAARTAYDLDMAERIPIFMVTPRKLRDADAFDEAVGGTC